MDQANVTIDAYADDGTFQAEAHQTETWTIELDSDGQGGYNCDGMPCGGVITNTPHTESYKHKSTDAESHRDISTDADTHRLASGSPDVHSIDHRQRHDG